MQSYFNRFTLTITKEQARTGAHPGPCDDDIKDLLTVPAIRRQLDKLPPEAIKAELKEYGAWDEDELNDQQENRARILWIACGNVLEETRR